MGRHTLNSSHYAYLAGFVDGEGCFRWDGTPRLEVTNTYPLVLYMLKETFGGSIRKRRTTHNRPTWVWSICGGDAMSAIRELHPYLREKLPQAILLMEMRHASMEHREILNKQLRALKRVRHEGVA